jgi:DNA-binding NarL/FixJ family response regulator
MARSKPIRLLMVDDHEVVRLGLRAVLELTPGIRMVGQAARMDEALALCRRLAPDIVLLDIHLPDGSGVDLASQILTASPATRVLFLTSFADDHTVREAALSGAHGYMLKNISSDMLIRAIRTVAAGEPLLDPRLTAHMPDQFEAGSASFRQRKRSSLSPQEQRLLPLVAGGFTNKEIAHQLQLSEKTVKNYLASIYAKLQIGRRAQIAALYAGSFKGTPVRSGSDKASVS